MSTSPRRLSPRWRDPRLAGSLALIALAGLAGGMLTSGPETVAVYQATATVLPGTPLAQAHLALADVPPALAGAYVRPGEVEETGVITATLRKGELLGRAHLGAPGGEGTRLVLPLAGPAPADASAGDAVTLWQVDSATALGEAAGARALCTGARLVSTTEADALAHSAELLLPADAVPEALAAMGAGSSFVLTTGGQL